MSRSTALRLVGGCVGVLVSIVGCKPGVTQASGGPSGTASAVGTTAPVPNATSAPATPKAGTAESYCAMVIELNTQVGTMVNRTFVPASKWTNEQRTAIAQTALSHRDEFLAATPSELRPDIELELQWYQNIANNGYDWSTAVQAAPPGAAQAFKRIGAYQSKHCGIKYS